MAAYHRYHPRSETFLEFDFLTPTPKSWVAARKRRGRASGRDGTCVCSAMRRAHVIKKRFQRHGRSGSWLDVNQSIGRTGDSPSAEWCAVSVGLLEAHRDSSALVAFCRECRHSRIKLKKGRGLSSLLLAGEPAKSRRQTPNPHDEKS